MKQAIIPGDRMVEQAKGQVAENVAGGIIRFTVYGTPVPQGSTRAFIPKGWKRAVITTDNKKLKPWRQEIAGVATAIMRTLNRPMIVRKIPVEVGLTFYFDRPKSLPMKRGYKTTKPDCDKLARAFLDGITGIVIEDDSQVVRLRVQKYFGLPESTEVQIAAIE